MTFDPSERPYAFRTNAAGDVTIHWRGRLAATLRGRAAARFLARVEGADEVTAQLAMAKATGPFKHGNERMARAREEERGG